MSMSETREAAMYTWIGGRAEVFLGFYVMAWVVALVLAHLLST